MKINALDETFDTLLITTEGKFVDKIDNFIEKNYGTTTLEDMTINRVDDITHIYWPYNAVGTDVLIRFIAELEYNDAE